MKKFFLTYGLLLFVVLSMNSCNNDLDISKDSSKSKSPYSFLTNINNEIVRQFKPDLLSYIKKDLINKGKVDQAKRLANTYDFKTGKLKSGAESTANSISGARKAARAAFNYTFVATMANSSGGTGTSTNYPNSDGECSVGNTSGSTNWWITGFRLSTTASYPAQWGDSNSFCINAHTQNGNWYGPTAANAGVSTNNKSKKYDSFWIWIGQNVANYTWYKAYLSDNTETPVTQNGDGCGVIGSGKSIVIMTFTAVNVGQ